MKIAKKLALTTLAVASLGLTMFSLQSASANEPPNGYWYDYNYYSNSSKTTLVGGKRNETGCGLGVQTWGTQTGYMTMRRYAC